MVEEITREEIVSLLNQVQLMQTKLLLLLNKYEAEQTETIRTEIPEPIWASTGTDGGKEVVHTTA